MYMYIDVVVKPLQYKINPSSSFHCLNTCPILSLSCVCVVCVCVFACACVRACVCVKYSKRGNPNLSDGQNIKFQYIHTHLFSLLQVCLCGMSTSFTL